MRVTLNEASQAEWQEQNLEHLRYEYDLTPDDLVIDLGAYRGEWAEQIYERYGCKIILVEPTPYILGCPYGQIINKAAWTEDGKLAFGGAYYYSSAHEDATHEYECFDINSLLSRYDEIALVKLNVEGSEFSLLPHIIGANLHRRIKNLQIQFHIIEGKPYEDWHEKIQAELNKSHRLTYFYPFCWESWCLLS